MYNIYVQIKGGADGPIALTGPDDAAEPNIIGVYSNREIEVNHGVEPHLEQTGEIPKVPSLYDYQMKQR